VLLIVRSVRRVGVAGRAADVGSHRLPVPRQLGAAAVNLEPGERVAEDAAVREGALHARRRGRVPEAPLQADDLAEPLDGAAREREVAEPRNRRASRLAIARAAI